MMVTWRNRLIACAAVMSVSLLPLSVYAQSTTYNMCLEGASVEAPQSPQQWLELSLQASHCYTFQARAVVINSVDVRTLALSHRIQEGVRQQVVQQLDGPSVSVERRSRVGQLAWGSADESPTLPSMKGWAEHASRFYGIALEEGARVAGRDAIKLRFEPKDQQRYTHEWWLDNTTGLLLKHVLSDPVGRILETFQVTQINEPERYTGEITVDAIPSGPDPEWHATWLPEGFMPQPVASLDGKPHQRLYSDGLATISIFAEPQGRALVPDQGLKSGVHQIGVSSIAVEEHVENNQRWQLVGIGELPPSMLQRIVHSVEFE